MFKINRLKSYFIICMMMCVMSGGRAHGKTFKEKVIEWNATTGHDHDGVNAGNTVPFTSLEGPINLEGSSLYGDITSSGNLQLESTSHATKGSILFNSVAAIIEDPGELIVGKQTPSAPIIGGVAHRCRISSVDEGANLVGVGSWQHNDVGALGTAMVGFRSRGTYAVPVIVNASDSLHGLIATGFDGTDYEYAAMILFGVDGTPGNNDMPGNIIFKVSPDGGVTPVESFRIKNDKNVLMATTNQFQFRDTGIALTSEVDGALSLVSDGTVNITPSVGGTPVFHVNTSTGHVGIGDNTPGSMLDIVSKVSTDLGLVVKGAVSQTADLFKAIDSSSNDLVVISANGSVGIGAVGPDTKFHISDVEPYITLLNTTNEDINFGRESKIEFKGRQSGGEESVLAKIQGSHEGVADDEKGSLIFYTNRGSDGSVLPESMRFDSQGQLGLGVVSIAEKLHVKGTSGNTYIKVQDSRSNTGDEVGIRFVTSPSDALFAKGLIGMSETGGCAVGTLFFANNGVCDSSNASYADAVLVIESDGDVGINTYTPDEDFQVVGTTKFGEDVTNYTKLESDGTLEFNGTATVWEDIRVPLSSIKRLGFSDPDWVQLRDNGSGSVGVYSLAFSTTTDEEVFFSVQMSHSYKESTDIEPHVHWSPSNTDAGGVTWGLEYTWINIDGTFGNTTIITVDDASDTVDRKHQVADFSSISGAGKTISSMLNCRLFRDVSDADDDYGSDAFVMEIDFHYEKDTVGSRTVTVK